MSGFAWKMVRAGLALCAGMLTYALIYFLTRGELGSYDEVRDLAAEYVGAALTSGLILCGAGTAAEWIEAKGGGE